MANIIKEHSTNQANKKALSGRCQVNDVLSLTGKRWLMTILYEISLGNNHFSTLIKGIPGISAHMLGSRIGLLVENNLVTKQEIENTIPMQITYTITTKSRQLLKIVDELNEWNRYWAD